ncbi:putative Ig domain-containing protein [Mucilaginibacter antarcticus]|uniref:putative Ig domain-containing protein n=1 Tax=Mucilaginibacter antarcticus TaxID=1855725 RepID=UPI003643AE74
MYVSDGGNATSNRIRMIDPSGTVGTIAGSATSGLANGVGTAATFKAPAGLSVDPVSGNIFIADAGNNQIRKIIGTGYFITPTLPTGLTFSSTTGIISGTPTTVTAAATYTITAFNVAGSSSIQISIETDNTEPNISYVSPVTYATSSAITSPTLDNTGSPVSATFGYSATSTQPLTGGIFSGPRRGAVDASGNIYVANFTGNTISKFTADGVLISNSYGTGAPALNNPAGIVFDSNNNMFVVNGAAATVYKYDASGAYQSTTTIPAGGTTTGICIDGSNNLYVTSTNGATYRVFKITSGGTVSSYVTTTTNLNNPVDISIDATGQLYVLNSGSGAIYKYAAVTPGAGTSFATGLTGSLALRVDAINSYLYVSDLTNTRILVYNTSGGASIATINSVTNCRGLFLDGKGSIYASDFTNNVVKKYTPTGTFFLNKALPSGLVLSKTTGAITGPTNATVATAADYTVTAWNSYGGGSAIINIAVLNAKTWSSTSSTSWSTAANWTGGVPGAADLAVIGSTATNLVVPSISAAGTTSVGSIQFLNTANTAPGITVASGSTLAVNGDITFQSTKATNLQANITGAGTITANNIIVTNSFSAVSYSITLASTVANLTLSGDLTLNSLFPTSGNLDDADFSLGGTGILTVKNIITNNVNAGNTPVFSVGNNTTLNLMGASALSGLSATGTNTLTIGTGTTIGYTGSNNQDVYVDLAIPRSTLTSGISYANIAFGGSGIKTPLGDITNNLNISGNINNTLTSNATDTFLDLTNTNVNFTGGTQALAAGAGTGTTLYNTTVSGGGTKTMSGTGTGIFTLASSSKLTLSGSSTLASGNVFTLASDATGSGTIPTIPSGSKITGTVTAQRFVTGGGSLLYRGYRLFSSPVSDITSAGAAPIHITI